MICSFGLGAQAGFYQTGSSLQAAPAAPQLHQTAGPFGLQSFSSPAPVSYLSCLSFNTDFVVTMILFLYCVYTCGLTFVCSGQFLSSNLQIAAAAAVQQQQQQQYRNSQPSYLKGGIGQQSQPPPPSSPSSQQPDMLNSVFSSGEICS